MTHSHVSKGVLYHSGHHCWSQEVTWVRERRPGLCSWGRRGPTTTLVLMKLVCIFTCYRSSSLEAVTVLFYMAFGIQICPLGPILAQ